MQRVITARALVISCRSFMRCLRNTVSNTILRSGTKKNGILHAAFDRSNRSSNRPSPSGFDAP